MTTALIITAATYGAIALLAAAWAFLLMGNSIYGQPETRDVFWCSVLSLAAGVLWLPLAILGLYLFGAREMWRRK